MLVRRVLVALFLLLLRAASVHNVDHTQLRAPRQWYVRPINQNRDLDSQYQRLVVALRTIDPQKHRNYFRMNRDRFDDLLHLIRPLIKHKPTHRLPISPETRLSLTLRYLASGDKFTSIAYNYHVSPSAVRQIVYETCSALCTALKNYIPEPSEEMWKQSADLYWKKCNFPNMPGSVDGKHLYIQAPRNSGSRFYNYKNRFSIVLLAVCGADYRFLYTHIGKPGRYSDSAVLAGSNFGRALDNEVLKLPKQSKLPGSDIILPFFFVGDEGFQLKKNFMRPFPRARIDHSTDRQKIFNYRLSRARRISENCFGILTNRWRILRDAMLVQPEHAKLIAMTCIYLHNYLITAESTNGGPAAYIAPQIGDDDSELRSIQPKQSNNFKSDAAAIRNKLTDYFCSPAGQVSWQYQIVRKGRILREQN